MTAQAQHIRSAVSYIGQGTLQNHMVLNEMIRSKIPQIFGIISISLLTFSSTLAQEGVVDNFVLGKKVSPFVRGIDGSGTYLSICPFLQAGGGYESNLYDAPQVFDSDIAASGSSHFVSEVNMVRNAPYAKGVGGIELGGNPIDAQYYRGIIAGQLSRYRDEPLADVTSFDSYLSYRWDVNKRIRLDAEVQYDINKGTSTHIFGIPSVLSTAGFSHLEGFVQFQALTIDAPWIGTGLSQVMGGYRRRDYDPFKKDANLELYDTTINLTTNKNVGINDSSESDYNQWRIRLRHIQGLWRGYSLRLAWDQIGRTYTKLRAKKAEPWKTGDPLYIDDTTYVAYMGEIPLDVSGNPNGPFRSQNETRLYGGIQYDPSHINDTRINAGIEWISITDPFEDFYGYDQWAFKLNAYYRPEPLRYIDISFATKWREYHKLKANYRYGEPLDDDTKPTFFNSPSMYPERDGGEPVKTTDNTYDNSWQQTLLKTTMFELSLRGQTPLTSFLAIWGLYTVDSRPQTNRMAGEIYSREYFNYSISGGITMWTPTISIKRNKKKQ